MLRRGLRAFAKIDFSLGEPPEQLIGRKIDENNFVGLIENSVWHRLAHTDLADFLDNVIEAFEMLDIDGGPDVEARRQPKAKREAAGRARHITEHREQRLEERNRLPVKSKPD